MLPFLQFIITLDFLITSDKLGGYPIRHVGQAEVIGEVLTGLLLGSPLSNLFDLPIFTDKHMLIEVEHLAELGNLLHRA